MLNMKYNLKQYDTVFTQLGLLLSHGVLTTFLIVFVIITAATNNHIHKDGRISNSCNTVHIKYNSRQLDTTMSY
jgi:hypothetical protein